MTGEVIDGVPRAWFAEAMRTAAAHFERTLSAVMWVDAFLSAALAVSSAAAAPIVAVVGVPAHAHFALAVGAIALCGLLAGCGAVTFVLIMVRLGHGEYLLPSGLRLPLPRAMRPPLADARS